MYLVIYFFVLKTSNLKTHFFEVKNLVFDSEKFSLLQIFLMKSISLNFVKVIKQ